MSSRRVDPWADFVSRAIADVRTKVVEEAWFGQEVTPLEPSGSQMEIPTEQAQEKAVPLTQTASSPWENFCAQQLRHPTHTQPTEQSHDHEKDRDMDR